MTKWQQINDIMATRDPDLLIDALWEDPAIQAKIRSRLGGVSIENIPYYHRHFCGGNHV